MEENENQKHVGLADASVLPAQFRPDTLPPATVSGDKPVNPLLQRARLPGETHRLPSSGAFYTHGELDDTCENGEVHVYAMTAIDEIVMSSTAKLFSGDAYLEVISRCVPNVKKPERLLAQDIDFILLCLRKISYGNTFDFTRKHLGCQKTGEDAEGNRLPPEEQVFQVNMNDLIDQTKYLDPASISKKYRIELGSGQMLKLEPIRFEDYVKLQQLNSQQQNKDFDVETRKNMFLDQAASVIESVDEISDKGMIREWLEIISPAEIKKMNSVVSDMSSWGVDSSIEILCRDCGEPIEVEIPTNPLALYS